MIPWPRKNNTDSNDGHARDEGGSSLAWCMDTKNRGSQIMDTKALYSEIMKIIIIIIIIIYSIYRALIPNGPKALYIIKNNDKILNLQNYIVIL